MRRGRTLEKQRRRSQSQGGKKHIATMTIITPISGRLEGFKEK
jgi:hypothetical protein